LKNISFQNNYFQDRRFLIVEGTWLVYSSLFKNKTCGVWSYWLKFKLNTFPGYGLNFGLFFLTNQKDHNYNHCDLFWKVVILTTSFETIFGVNVTAIVWYMDLHLLVHSVPITCPVWFRWCRAALATSVCRSVVFSGYYGFLYQ
jgi:hypothetical protein